MPRALLLTLIGLAACAGQGLSPTSAEPGQQRAPVLSLIRDPGFGERAFLFALYDDGTVIHVRDRQGASAGYVRAKLSPNEKAALLRRLRPEELRSIPRRFDHGCDWPAEQVHAEGGSARRAVGLDCWTDRPTHTLAWRGGGEPVMIDILGELDGKPGDDRSEAPAALLRIWDALVGFEAEGETWVPDRTLLAFLSQESFKYHSKLNACPWPSELGGEHPGAEEFRDGKICRVLSAAVRKPARDWLHRCHAFARLDTDWYVSVLAWDLLPGEQPEDAAWVCR